MGKVKGLTQGNNSSDSKSSHTAPPPRPDPPKARLPDPTPPPVKRPRPGPSPSQQPRQIAPSQPAYSQEQDDDIQEVAPIVKSEPTSHVPAEAQYQQGQGIVADPNMEYGEEYGEYEGYEEGDYDTSMMDPNMSGADGNKGPDTSVLEEYIEKDHQSGYFVYSCNICGKTFNGKNSLSTHMSVMHRGHN